MVQTIQASNLTLHEVEAKFGLQEVQDAAFFPEWQLAQNSAELTDEEQRSLDQVKADFLYLSEYLMGEEAVKLVMLSPLLSMAGFYRPPFRIRLEASVQIAIEDEGELLPGCIHVLVLQERLWVLVVESKEAGFSLKDAIAQSLAYMITTPYPDKPAFGLATNGSEFRFLKLVQPPTPQYGLSDLLTLQRRENDLYAVLRILKQLGNVIRS